MVNSPDKFEEVMFRILTVLVVLVIAVFLLAMMSAVFILITQVGVDPCS